MVMCITIQTRGTSTRIEVRRSLPEGHERIAWGRQNVESILVLCRGWQAARPLSGNGISQRDRQRHHQGRYAGLDGGHGELAEGRRNTWPVGRTAGYATAADRRFADGGGGRWRPAAWGRFRHLGSARILAALCDRPCSRHSGALDGDGLLRL